IPKTNNFSSSQPLKMAKKIAKKDAVAEEKLEKNTPHTWTHKEKAEILEGIAKCRSKGLATNNGNLNKLGWT
ncbi:hypothetical protein VP01_15269g1, partial [Puccinia sorghi]